MKLENYEVHLPSYSIGSTIYSKIGPVCESYGRTVLVIGGEKALAAAYQKIAAAVAKTKLTIIGKELFGADCTYDNVERLRALLSISRPTWYLESVAARHWTQSNACA